MSSGGEALVGGMQLLGLWGEPHQGQVIGVTGGAGGTAAVVADVEELGAHLSAVLTRLDEQAVLAELARGILEVQFLTPWAPVEVAAAAGACSQAVARVGAATAQLQALVHGIECAAQAYAGTEEAVTRSWHLLTSAAAPGAFALVVVTEALQDGLGMRGVGTVKSASAEIALDGLATRLGLDSDIGRQVRSEVEHATGRVGDAEVVEDSPLRQATALAATTFPATNHATQLVGSGPVWDARADPAARPGFGGLVGGVSLASEAGEVTVRHRTLVGPQGTRTAYVISLPGTDAWAPGTLSPRDLGSDLAQLGGLHDDAYVDAVLEIVERAPQDATIVLVGHSLGGITASTVAARAAARGRRVAYVVTAGSPVDTMRVPRGTTVVSLQNAADVVPGLDGMPARDRAGRTTVVVDDDRGSSVANHAIGVYADAARAADDLAGRDPGLRATRDQMVADGALVAPGDTVTDVGERYRILREPR